MTSTLNILHIDSSARKEGSVSRDLSAAIVAQLSKGRDTSVTYRDVSSGVALIDEGWVGANFTPADARTPEQAAQLAESDALIKEALEADILVFGVPIYNFSVPAALKLWIDQICRAGVTFEYSASGPKGLLTDKKAYIALASGGTEMDSDIDFAGRYMRHVLGFIGITDVEFIRADQLAVNAEVKLEQAKARIDLIVA